MATHALETLYDTHIKPLSLRDHLQLIELMVHRAKPMTREKQSRRQWSEIKGCVTHPLLNEDAQDWISRTRLEDRR